MSTNVNLRRLPRPGGTPSTGVAITAESNFFQIKIDPRGQQIQFDVKAHPECDNMNRLINKNKSIIREKLNASTVSPNNHILYALVVGTVVSDIDIDVEYEEKAYKLEIKKTAEHAETSIATRDAARQSFHHALRDAAKAIKYAPSGEYVYLNEKINVPSTDQVKLLRGFFLKIASAVSNKLLLNVDIKHRILQSGTVLDYLNKSRSQDESFAYLVNRKVLVTHKDARFNLYTVLRVMDPKDMTINSTFTKKDGTQISFKDYFKQQHGKDLKPNQPMLEVEQRKGQVAYLPSEVAQITGLDDELKRNEALMDHVAAVTRMLPSKRREFTVEFVRRLLNDPKSSALLESYGISVDAEPVQVTGHRVTGNQLKVISKGRDFGARFTGSATPQMGQDINIDRPDFPHYTTKEIVGVNAAVRWVVVGLHDARNANYMDILVNTLNENARRYNLSSQIKIDAAVVPEAVCKAATTPEAKMGLIKDQVMKMGNPNTIQVVFFVIPHLQGDAVYKLVKKFFNPNGIATQGIQSKNITSPNEKKRNTVITRAFQQAVAKRRGALYTLNMGDVNTGPANVTQFIGIDTQNNALAVSATTDRAAVTCYTGVRRLKSRDETAEPLKEMIKSAFARFHDGKVQAKHIIVYRSGVSEGAKDECYKREMGVIMEALSQVQVLSAARVYYIFVNTNVNQRFIAKDAAGFKNSPSLTIYANEIVSADRFDFYVAHQNVTQGCLTPTHYDIYGACAASNSAAFLAPDALPRVTAQLSCMYQNWPGPIRIPSVVMNARKVNTVCSALGQYPSDGNIASSLYFL